MDRNGQRTGFVAERSREPWGLLAPSALRATRRDGLLLEGNEIGSGGWQCSVLAGRQREAEAA